jgi:hypothetical protein
MTPDAGFQGMDTLLQSSLYINLSINDAVAQYAPAMENNTAGYQQFLTNVLGVSGSTPLSSLSPSQFFTMKKAITVQEGLYAKLLCDDDHVLQLKVNQEKNFDENYEAFC